MLTLVLISDYVVEGVDLTGIKVLRESFLIPVGGDTNRGRVTFLPTWMGTQNILGDLCLFSGA